MKKILAFIIISSLWIALYAKRDLTYFWQDKDGVINAQTSLSFDLIETLLDENPPSLSTPTNGRKAALHLLDQIFHDTRLDNSPIVCDYLDQRMNKALEVMKMPCDSGLRIVKLYNDGWIIQSPEVTIGWDIYRGKRLPDGSRSLMKDSIASALAEACDILFLTHNHGDHVDPFVVECFTSAGKPVIATEEIMPTNEHITHVRYPEIHDTIFTTLSEVKLPVTVIPGHQDHLQNNIYIVELPCGQTVCSTGDQWSKEDLEMLLNLADKVPPTDIFLPICWAASIHEMCRSFGAKVVLTGHENELGDHSIDHREAYWLSLDKLEDLEIPNCVMTWGEVLPLSSEVLHAHP